MIDFILSSHGARFVAYFLGVFSTLACRRMIEQKDYGNAAACALLAIAMFTL